MKRNRPQQPMYLDLHPADHSRTRYSTPKNTTKQISIQKRVSFAKSIYLSMVESTLNIRQTSTNMNLPASIGYPFSRKSGEREGEINLNSVQGKKTKTGHKNAIQVQL